MKRAAFVLALAAGCAPPRPAGFADLHQARAIDIHDSWLGLGPTWEVTVRLERRGPAFEGDANVRGRDGEVRTEHARVPAAVVEAFLVEVGGHAIDPKQEYDEPFRSSDDYPKVEIRVLGAGEPIVIGLADQHRHWRAAGKFLTPDPPPQNPSENGYEHHARINVAYATLRDALGLSVWKHEPFPQR